MIIVGISSESLFDVWPFISIKFSLLSWSSLRKRCEERARSCYPTVIIISTCRYIKSIVLITLMIIWFWYLFLCQDQHKNLPEESADDAYFCCVYRQPSRMSQRLRNFCSLDIASFFAAHVRSSKHRSSGQTDASHAEGSVVCEEHLVMFCQVFLWRSSFEVFDVGAHFFDFVTSVACGSVSSPTSEVIFPVEGVLHWNNRIHVSFCFFLLVKMFDASANNSVNVCFSGKCVVRRIPLLDFFIWLVCWTAVGARMFAHSVQSWDAVKLKTLFCRTQVDLNAASWMFRSPTWPQSVQKRHECPFLVASSSL